MKANISTDTGIRSVNVSASYQYKGVDIFLILTGFEATASEWRTGFRIACHEFQMSTIVPDDEAILIIVNKANAVMDRAIERGKLIPVIDKAILEHGIINEGKMQLLGNVPA